MYRHVCDRVSCLQPESSYEGERENKMINSKTISEYILKRQIFAFFCVKIDKYLGYFRATFEKWARENKNYNNQINEITKLETCGL